MARNLPDDVTPSDIDDAFGPPDEQRVLGIVTVDTEAIVPADATDAERREALREAVEDGDIVQVLEADVMEVERA